METHGCDYLLANDIDMEPVPGYAVANWEKGYGDFVMKPDLATLRRVPWLPATALVLCDVLDHHHHEPLEHSPRAMLRKQIARLSAMNMSSYFASELEFYLFDETYESAEAKAWRDIKTTGSYIQDYHVFQTTKEEGVMPGPTPRYKRGTGPLQLVSYFAHGRSVRRWVGSGNPCPPRH